jgi:2-desacetyl-2-hydroxyethyl bacteriochlorophyllide A dehydrogenase
MKAAIWTGIEEMIIGDLPIPDFTENEVLLRIVSAGVCGTDLSIYKGKFDASRSVPPMVLGHEFCGIIEKIGRGVQHFSIGDFVAADALLSCGECYACQNGFPHVCTRLRLLGVDLNGGFAEYIVVNEKKLHRLPENMPGLLGGIIEPCAVALHDVRLSGYRPGDNVLIIGGGPIGILCAEILKNSGVNRLMVSEINEARLELLSSHEITVISPKEPDFNKIVKDFFSGHGPDISFEISGTNAGYQSAIDTTRVRGTIVQVGLSKGESSVDLRRANFAELSIKGARVYEPVDFSGAINMLSSGKINTKGIVSEHSLSDCPDIFKELVSGDTRLIKPVIKIS